MVAAFSLGSTWAQLRFVGFKNNCVIPVWCILSHHASMVDIQSFLETFVFTLTARSEILNSSVNF